MLTIPTTFMGHGPISSDFLGLNGTYFWRQAHIDYTYTVRNEAWHNVVFILCPSTNFFAVGSSADAAEEESVTAIAAEYALAAGGAQSTSSKSASSAALDLPTYTALRREVATTSSQRDSRKPLSRIAINTAQVQQQQQHTISGEQQQQLSGAITAMKHVGFKSAKVPLAFIDGNIAFHNPYGYIPAELYGILPFEVRSCVILLR